MDDQESAGSQLILERQILTYLLQFPEAKDTVTGIRQWWLSNVTDDFRIGEIEEALNSLIARGWVIIRKIKPSQMVYGLNERKLDEIKAYLRKGENGRDSKGCVQ